MEYKFHPKVRKVDSDTRKEIEQHMQLNANRRMIQQTYKEKTGKQITMKDLHNIGTKMRITTESSTSDVQGIGDWLKSQHPGVDCEFVADENNVLTGIFIQDAEMKSTFDRFPEVILADSTYKTNNLNLALYAMLLYYICCKLVLLYCIYYIYIQWLSTFNTTTHFCKIKCF